MGNQTHTYAGHWNGHICDQIYLTKNKPIIIIIIELHFK